MSDGAVADTIAAYAEAALQAKTMGFDTIEIHGGHGYLVDQFFWASTNKRNDRYGGIAHKDRSSFAAEVVSAVRAAVGPDFPIILRLSQWKGQDYAARMAEPPGEMADWLTPLVDAGVDILHCSQRRFWEPEFSEIDGAAGLNLAGWAKKLTGAATISVGSVGLSGDVISSFSGESSTPTKLDELVRRMENDEFDLIAVGRALITDPNWVNKVRARPGNRSRCLRPTVGAARRSRTRRPPVGLRPWPRRPGPNPRGTVEYPAARPRSSCPDGDRVLDTGRFPDGSFAW